MTRKEFLKSAALGASALLCAGAGMVFWKRRRLLRQHQRTYYEERRPGKPWKWSMEGYHYASDGEQVECQVCPNRCVLDEGDRSICRSKVNIGGKLYSLTYGNPCAVHVDPIEKKPLAHFIRAPRPFPSPPPAATSGASTARTGKFHRRNRNRWNI
jgi:pyruvate formate lyase activating enzyme